MNPSDLASLFRFVLVRTSHPGNIGGAARAIRTMGFTRLELVAPQRFPDREADALAANAVLIVAGVHAVAALFHHLFLRDATLRRMLPWRAH